MHMTDTAAAEKLLGSTVGRILLAVLQTIVGSIAFMLLLLVWHPLDIQLLKFLLVGIVGVLAGFTARRILIDRARPLKIFTALVSVVVSLIVLSLISGGFVGIDIFGAPKYMPDWAGIFQFALAALGAWLALLAAHSPRTAIPARLASGVQTGNRPREAPRLKSRFPRISFPSIRPIIARVSAAVSTARDRIIPDKTNALKVRPPAAKTPPPAKKRASNKPAPARLTLPAKKEAALVPKKQRKRPGKRIKFDSKIEHTCPYCLEPVKAHDSRGVKICPVCKTHHHADCWGITGACQIPHAQ